MDPVNQDAQKMLEYGFIYADGSYSDERLPKGATLVPRRPSPQHKWDAVAKRWVSGEMPVPESKGSQFNVAGNRPTGWPGSEMPANAPDPDLNPAIAGLLGNTTTPAKEDS